MKKMTIKDAHRIRGGYNPGRYWPERIRKRILSKAQKSRGQRSRKRTDKINVMHSGLGEFQKEGVIDRQVEPGGLGG